MIFYNNNNNKNTTVERKAEDVIAKRGALLYRENLTYSKLLTEDRLLSQCWAVPPAISELVLTFIDSHLGPFSNDYDGIRAALANGSLPWGQAWNLVADDVRSQSHHRWQRSEEKQKSSVRTKGSHSFCFLARAAGWRRLQQEGKDCKMAPIIMLTYLNLFVLAVELETLCDFR